MPFLKVSFLARHRLRIPAETIPVKLMKLPIRNFLMAGGIVAFDAPAFIANGTMTEQATAPTYETPNYLTSNVFDAFRLQ